MDQINENSDAVREIIYKRMAKRKKCGKPIKGCIPTCGRPKGHFVSPGSTCEWQPENIDYWFEIQTWRRSRERKTKSKARKR